jgi:hypothetical protein
MCVARSTVFPHPRADDEWLQVALALSIEIFFGDRIRTATAPSWSIENARVVVSVSDARERAFRHPSPVQETRWTPGVLRIGFRARGGDPATRGRGAFWMG